MRDSVQVPGISLSRRGLLRTATGVVVAGALLESVAGASAAPSSSGQAGPPGAQTSDITVTITPPQGVAPLTFDASEVDFGQAASSTGSASSGAGAGKVTYKPFHITKEWDASSATIIQWLETNSIFLSIVVTFTAAAGQTTITLTNAKIVDSATTIAIKSQGEGVKDVLVTQQVLEIIFGGMAIQMPGQGAS